MEQVAGLGPPAPVLSAIAVEGGKTEQGGGLATAEAAEFGHGSTEAGGIDGSAAGDRLDDGVTATELGVGDDTCAHAAVAVFDVGMEGLARGGGAASGLGAEFGAEVAQRGELLDELAAQDEQVTEQEQVARLRRGRRGGRSGPAWRIDAVVLGALADGFGKASRAQGIDQDGF